MTESDCRLSPDSPQSTLYYLVLPFIIAYSPEVAGRPLELGLNLNGRHVNITSQMFVGTVLRPSTRSVTLCIKRRISTSTMGALGRHTVNTTERLTALRKLMAQNEPALGAFVVPSEDQRECLIDGRHSALNLYD